MKSIWNGSVSFGLVNINISIYPAIQEHTLGFKLLCKKCHTPITYERFCKNCNKEIVWHDIVKGLKLPDGSYFILTQEKLHELRAIKTDTIDIKQFVNLGQIKPIYLEGHYYVLPEKHSEKVYFLFKRALEETHTAAIGQFVMRDKEYICAIMPQENVLLLSTLHYSYEIRDIDAINVLKKEPKFSTQELKLAEQLINKLSSKTFKLDIYKDTFAQRIAQEIKKGKSKKSKKSIAKKKSTKKENNLVSSLKNSLSLRVKREKMANIKPAKKHQPHAIAKSKNR